MVDPAQGQTYQVLRLSQCTPDDARALLQIYADQVYFTAFPEPDLRKSPPDWVEFFDEAIPSPAPWTDVILLVAGDDVWGGATIEYYRKAGAGLLTYIAISPKHRGKRLGHVLIEKARKVLTERGGNDAAMYAETERYEDAHNDEERKETVVRQRQLTALGAYETGFDYVMPPLRPDASPRRLHLLLLDPTQPGRAPAVSSAVVRVLLDELARSLGTELDAHPDTANVLQFLQTDRNLMLRKLPAVNFDEAFCETPIFNNVKAVAFSFAFELHFRYADDCKLEGSALLLNRIAEDLNKDAFVQTELVEPTRSFLDDVTTGPPGRNGRPLLFLAARHPFDDRSRQLRMIRPPCWLYKAEDSRRQLRTTSAPIEFVLQDNFCAFESGRLFYVITLFQNPDSPQLLDEYGIIQLQNLAMRPDDDDQVRKYGELLFDWQPEGLMAEGQPCDFWQLAERRLAWLEQLPNVDKPCAIRDIICRYEIQPRKSTRLAIKPCDLKNLCVSIEDEAIMAAAEKADQAFGFLDGNGANHDLIEAAEFAAPFTPTPAMPPPHQDAENAIDRKMLALAGIATGVPDFPWQDTSEVHDSVRPAAQAVDAAMYVHPRFTLEVAREWRSFHNSMKTLGNCPYLLLMWIVSLHDELVVETIEQGINDMVYGSADSDLGYRTMAMADVDQIRRRARRVLPPSGNSILERNLQRRFDLFRFNTIHRSGRIFRYPKEKGALERLLEEKGLTQRFDRAQQLIDRIEGLVEDVTSIKSAFAERRTNLALSGIAILSIIGISGDLAEMLAQIAKVSTILIAGVLILAVFIFLFWSDFQSDKRE